MDKQKRKEGNYEPGVPSFWSARHLTGKTTYLSEQVERAAGRYGASTVAVCSYTKAAAHEIAGRVDLPKGNAATLHSFCYRALGAPKLTEGHEKEFNEAFPRHRVSGNAASVDDPYGDRELEHPGDSIRQEMDLLRARRIDPEMWPNRVKVFHKHWTDWKNNAGLLDFTDMLEIALRDQDQCPGEPAVLFVDEVQDSPKLQLDLIWKWAAHVDTCIMAGDDDQAIYQFAGATPEAFLALDVPEANKRVLSQSYRVPRAVHAVAEKMVRKIKHRQAKEYAPRDCDGEVMRCQGSFRQPWELTRHARKFLEAGKSVMFLGSCSYMVNALMAQLKKEAIPFHNPYRRKNGGWNPLYSGDGERIKRTMPVDRVLSFLRPDADTWGDESRQWTNHDLATWFEPVEAKGFLFSGAKADLKAMKGDMTPFDPQRLLTIVEPSHHEELDRLSMGGSHHTAEALRWWAGKILSSQRAKYSFPVDVAKKHGGRALREEPKVIIGTGHSVKGGQADVVYLMPDLSMAGMREWTGSGKDTVIRLMYVMATRARETLVVCEPGGQFFAELR